MQTYSRRYELTDGKLAVRVQLALQCEGSRPWIGTNTLEDEHAVVDGGACVRTVHVGLRRWSIRIDVGSEDYIPVVPNLVKLRCPEIK